MRRYCKYLFVMLICIASQNVCAQCAPPAMHGYRDGGSAIVTASINLVSYQGDIEFKWYINGVFVYSEYFWTDGTGWLGQTFQSQYSSSGPIQASVTIWGCEEMISEEYTIPPDPDPLTVFGEGIWCQQTVTFNIAVSNPNASVYVFKTVNGGSFPIYPTNGVYTDEYLYDGGQRYYVEAHLNNQVVGPVEMYVHAEVPTPTVTPASATVCPGGSVQLTVSPSSHPASNFHWYAISGASVGTGHTHTTNKDVYVRIETDNCIGPSRYVTVNTSNPSPPSAQRVVMCEPGTASITAAGQFTAFKWFDESGVLIPGKTERTLNVDVDQTTAFYVSGINSFGCESPKSSVIRVFVVNEPYILPNGVNQCQQFASGLTAHIPAFGYMGDITVNLYKNGALVNAESILATTGLEEIIQHDYEGHFVNGDEYRVSVNFGNCGERLGPPYRIDIPYVGSTASGQAVLCHYDVTFDITSEPGAILQVFRNEVPLIPENGVFTDEYFKDGPVKYYLVATYNGCTSQPGEMSLFEITPPNPTVIPSAPSVCSGETVLLTASCIGCPDDGFQWYDANQNPLSNKTPQIEAGNDVYVTASIHGCKSDFVLADIDIIPLPVAPVMNNIVQCAWEEISLEPSIGARTSTIRWYDQNSQTILHEGLVFNRQPLNETGQFTFEAEAISKEGCISPNKTQFTVTIPEDCDDRINWIQNTGYDVNGVIADTRTYYDDNGVPVQSQVRHLTRSEVLASQTLPDKYDRPAISTLVAPTDLVSFRYKPWFVTDNTGAPYSHTMFNNPIGNSTPGTLGWYYSNNNTKEENVPITGFPYSQKDYYQDGTGEARKGALAGDKHRMGSGHEVLSGTFPVFSELNDYMTKRAAALPTLTTDGSLVNEAVQFVTRDANGKYTIAISDKSGNTVMTCRPGTATDNVLSVVSTITSSGNPDSDHYRPMTYFYLPSETNVNISGATDFVVENTITGETVSMASGNWPEGFYRVLLMNGNSEVIITFLQYFTDVSYQFYDDAGRLVSSVSPNGYQTWSIDPSGYAILDKTTYEYNHQGWLLNTIEPDASKTQYVYRKDGKIRFSQNAEQQIKNTFSYTHYDKLGRPVESGEYKGTGVSFVAMNATGYVGSAMQTQVDKTFDQVSWTDADKKDWVRTYYDLAVVAIDNLPSTFKQEFVRGAVARTENKNMKTWYSYNEFGRVTWMAQKPAALNRTFVTLYTYDFLGNVLDVQNVTYVNQSAINPFYHHYEYDVDKRLSKVLTSTDGNTKKLRATYEYYLHGPLKRIELGDAMQGIDFVYNIQGWLTQINHPDKTQDPGGDTNDAFGMVLDYYESAMNGLLLSQGANVNPAEFHKLPEFETGQFESNFALTVTNNRQSNNTEVLNSFRQIEAQYKAGVEKRNSNQK